MPSKTQVADDTLRAYGIFREHPGALVLEDLKEQLYHYGTTFVPGDPHATARNEGARWALLYVMAQMEALKELRDAEAEAAAAETEEK